MKSWNIFRKNGFFVFQTEHNTKVEMDWSCTQKLLQYYHQDNHVKNSWIQEAHQEQPDKEQLKLKYTECNTNETSYMGWLQIKKKKDNLMLSYNILQDTDEEWLLHQTESSMDT